VKVGDLVRILRAETFAIVVGFDDDNDPIICGFVGPHASGQVSGPIFRNAVEVVSESR
jgi:hypothetical protein